MYLDGKQKYFIRLFSPAQTVSLAQTFSPALVRGTPIGDATGTVGDATELLSVVVVVVVVQ